MAQLNSANAVFINVNFKDKDDWTPLHNAASAGKLDICEAILKAAGEVNNKRKKKKKKKKQEEEEETF